MKRLFLHVLYGMCVVISELFYLQSSRFKALAGEEVVYQDTEFFSDFGPRILMVRQDEKGNRQGHHLTGFFAIKFLFEKEVIVSGGPVVFSKGKNDLRFVGTRSAYAGYNKYCDDHNSFPRVGMAG